MSEYTGKKCIVCGNEFMNWDEGDIVLCPQCGEPYHKDCYKSINACGRCGTQTESGAWRERFKKGIVHSLEQESGREKSNEKYAPESELFKRAADSFTQESVRTKTDAEKSSEAVSGLNEVRAAAANYYNRMPNGYSSGLFSNIGDKIKKLAVIITVIQMAAGIITCIAVSIMSSILLGLPIGALICLTAWIGAFVLYGFGELISSSQRTARTIDKVLDELNEMKKQGIK